MTIRQLLYKAAQEKNDEIFNKILDNLENLTLIIDDKTNLPIAIAEQPIQKSIRQTRYWTEDMDWEWIADCMDLEAPSWFVSLISEAPNGA